MKCHRQFVFIIIFLMAVILIAPTIIYADTNDELIEAATFGDIAKVKDLIERGADLNAKSLRAKGGVHNTTALMRAAYQGHIEIVNLLLDRGANVNIKDNSGNSALMWALYGSNMSIAKLLIEKGADVKKGEGWAVLREVISGPTEFVSAGLGGHSTKAASESEKIEIVKLLIKNGADVNWYWYKGGETTLSAALLSGKNEIAKILLESGADPNIQMSNDQTPLMFAIANNDTAMINLLMDKKADVNLKSADDSTALMIAAGRGRVGIADALIKKGADVNLKNKKGDTALSLAKMNGHTEVIKLLKQAGAVEPREETLSPPAKEQKTSRPILYFDVEGTEGEPLAVTKGVYPDGQSLGTVVRGAGAVWSPDGAWFVNVTEENSLTMRNLRGEVRNIFTPAKERLWHPIWSPDGERIALISESSGENPAKNVFSVVVIDVLKKEVHSRHRLPFVPYFPRKFRWSPDGRKILLVGGFSTEGGAVVIDTETSTIETIASKLIFPEWAPSSDSVYYFDMDPYKPEAGDFYFKRLGTSPPEKLMDKKKVESLGLKEGLLMNLSPKSSKILIYGGMLLDIGDAKKEFKGTIYIYDIYGKKTVTLDKPFKKIRTQGLIYFLEWAPDERRIAALLLDFSQATAEKESPYIPTGSLKINIFDLSKEIWRTLATVNTKDVPATELLDFIGMTNAFSW